MTDISCPECGCSRFLRRFTVTVQGWIQKQEKDGPRFWSVTERREMKTEYSDDDGNRIHICDDCGNEWVLNGNKLVKR